MYAKDIFLLVSMKVQDLGAESQRRWPWSPDPSGLRASLTEFLNAAIRQVALVRPDSVASTGALRLAPGASQRVPASSTTLLDIVRNLGADGATPGNPIVQVSKEASMVYDWKRTGATVEAYQYDALDDPSVFRVFPAVPASKPVWVEVVTSLVPPVVSSPNDVVPLASSFAGPLEHWMLYQVLAGDNSASNLSKAQQHWQAFYQALGVKIQSDMQFMPRVGRTEGEQ